jgi:hypothetical protein
VRWASLGSAVGALADVRARAEHNRGGRPTLVRVSPSQYQLQKGRLSTPMSSRGARFTDLRMLADGIYAHVSEDAEVRTEVLQVILPWYAIGDDELHCSE